MPRTTRGGMPQDRAIGLQRNKRGAPRKGTKLRNVSTNEVCQAILKTIEDRTSRSEQSKASAKWRASYIPRQQAFGRIYRIAFPDGKRGPRKMVYDDPKEGETPGSWRCQFRFCGKDFDYRLFCLTKKEAERHLDKIRRFVMQHRHALLEKLQEEQDSRVERSLRQLLEATCSTPQEV